MLLFPLLACSPSPPLGVDAARSLAESDHLAKAVDDGVPRVPVPGVLADRLAVSPDGAWIAYVAPADGLASVWIVAADGGEPHQLTNVGLRPAKGGPPAGWVAPPHAGPLAFDGDWLRWRSPDGEEAVRWR